VQSDNLESGVGAVLERNKEKFIQTALCCHQRGLLLTDIFPLLYRLSCVLHYSRLADTALLKHWDQSQQQNPSPCMRSVIAIACAKAGILQSMTTVCDHTFISASTACSASNPSHQYFFPGLFFGVRFALDGI
jgi:hypothetical protein